MPPASGRACGCSTSRPAPDTSLPPRRARGGARGRRYRRGNAGRGAARSPAARLPARRRGGAALRGRLVRRGRGGVRPQPSPPPGGRGGRARPGARERRAARAVVGRAGARALPRAGPGSRRPSRRVPSAQPPAGPDPFRFADDAQLRALLGDAGLEDVAVETVAIRHRVGGDATQLWDGLLAGSVRSAAAVEALEPGGARARLRGVRRAGRARPRPGGHELPAVAKVGSGRRP